MLFDGGQLVNFSPTTARAGFTRSLPRVSVTQIRIPKGPCPTLLWPGVVHPAVPRMTVEENTVPVRMRKFLQTLTYAYQSHVLAFKLLHTGGSHFLGERSNLCLVHPDKTGGTGTAISTLRAFEFQTIFVPREFCHRYYFFRDGLTDIPCWTRALPPTEIVVQKNLQQMLNARLTNFQYFQEAAEVAISFSALTVVSTWSLVFMTPRLSLIVPPRESVSKHRCIRGAQCNPDLT